MINKFLFNDDFDVKTLEPPPITYDQDDLDIACREHFLKGFEEGRFQALQEIEASCRILLDQIQSSLNALDRFQIQSQQTVALIIEKTLETLLPHFCEKGALSEIQHIIQDVLKKVIDVQTITILCAEELMPTLEEFIKTLTTQAIITLKGESSYGKSSIRIEWKGGFVERNEHQLCEDIQHLLKNYKKEVSHVEL